ncbi:helix-turn-helix domain-containing protein [Bacillus sp. N9]
MFEPKDIERLEIMLDVIKEKLHYWKNKNQYIYYQYEYFHHIVTFHLELHQDLPPNEITALRRIYDDVKKTRKSLLIKIKYRDPLKKGRDRYMPVRKQTITHLGWEIKRCLAQKKMTQTEFCKLHGIPLSRLSEIISGTRPNKKYKSKIIDILQIEEVGL